MAVTFAGSAPAALVDGIAAQVGDDIVLLSEVLRTASTVAQQIEEQGGSADDLAQVHREALDRLIERALVRQVVRRAELIAGDSEVDEAIAGIAEENNITIDQLQRSVESQGLPYEAYREKIRDEIEQSRVISAMVTSQIRVEDEEVREIYESEYAGRGGKGVEARIRQILIPRAGNPEACKQVSAARDRVLAGEPFDLVASQTSYINPQRGGDLGWTPIRDLAQWMRAIAEDLPAGTMSDVVELDHACTVFLVEARQDASKRTLEDVRPEIEGTLRNQRSEGKYREFIEEIRDRTYIDRRIDFNPEDFRNDSRTF